MGSRREFIKKVALGSVAVAAGGALSPAVSEAAQAENLTWVEGHGPYDNTIKAINELGGMKRFVQKGQRVLVLPNIGWARTPEEAANTNPDVVKAIINECEILKPKSITVFTNPCNDMRVCLDRSGIGDVVDETSARFEFINKEGWRKRDAVKGCTYLKSTEVYRLFDDSDVIINCPVAKHHGGAQLTMCCKNLMGAIKDRRHLHQSLHPGIADLTMMVPVDLSVLDATRILLRNGPSGGDVKDTEVRNSVIAGLNMAQVDCLGVTLFEKKPNDIGYLKILAERGYAEMRLSKLDYSRIGA